MFVAITSWFVYVVSTVVLIKLVEILIQHGVVTALKVVAAFLASLPGIKGLVKAFTQKEVKGFMKDNFAQSGESESQVVEIPRKGKLIFILKKQLYF